MDRTCAAGALVLNAESEKQPPSRSLDASFAGRAGQPVHTLLRAVQALNARGAASWGLLHTLGLCAFWLGTAIAVPPYRFS